jgi:hypothetical protein
MTNKKKPHGNIFNTPMDLRHWAVTLIGYLGNSQTNTLPNNEKVDMLIHQFVTDYNYYYLLQNKTEEEE